MIVDRLSTRYDYHASLSRLQRDKNMGEFGDERQIADVVIFLVVLLYVSTYRFPPAAVCPPCMRLLLFDIGTSSTSTER